MPVGPGCDACASSRIGNGRLGFQSIALGSDLIFCSCIPGRRACSVHVQDPFAMPEILMAAFAWHMPELSRSGHEARPEPPVAPRCV
jgi:hypothetical protein